MREIVPQIEIRRADQGNAMERSCSCYACPNESAFIMRVGGGTEINSSYTQLRMCDSHWQLMLSVSESAWRRK